MKSALQLSNPMTFTHAVEICFRICEVDRAVAYGLLSRIWQILAGPVTIVLVARFFSPNTQGFYYTFASLLALQSFVELGFYVVVINLASHEWSQLRINSIGCIEGDPRSFSRLASLGRLVFKWYAAASVLFVVIVSVVGFVFFLRSDYPEVQWQGPWLTVVILTGILLWMLPFNSLLEGCNQVATINLFRFAQSSFSSLVLWAALVWGLGLWAAAAMVGARVLANAYLLLVHYRHFLEPLFRSSVSAKMSWRDEIWPMQWRLGLSGIVNYFAFSLFSPVMFHYHSATLAGRMGMTWQIVGALQAVGLAWITAKVPRFGMLIAQEDYGSLDRLWFRTSAACVAVVSFGAVLLWSLLVSLNKLEIQVAQRLLSPLPAGLFLISSILMTISQCQTAYLRAHKKEPILVMSVVSSLLIGAVVWFFGGRFGPVGAAGGHLGVVTIAVLWESTIWCRCRSDWHIP